MHSLAILAAALALAAGCKTVAKGDVFEAQIKEQLAAKGITAEVACPDAIPLGRVEDNQFDCDITEVSGARTPVIVKLDDKGNWSLAARQSPIDPMQGLGDPPP